ncbi:staphylopine uptake ABC transporter permease subunit CntC [Marinicrinis sediminis]|uniref:Staphylopine uptake ABC transporter permease subunit CntC n=1 Tax=Marinicrinis sediminis TaxID=1652465 RepID=A0ABW5R7J3_9BACL
MAVLRRFTTDKLAAISCSVLVLTLMFGLMAPWIAPHDPYAVHIDLRYASASWSYPLGNDHLGRCIMSRLIYGIRPSVIWVLAALFLSVGIGALAGFVAGYYRGKVDAVLMRLCDIVLSFPAYVTTLAVVGLLGVGLTHILIAFILVKWAWFARVIRTAVMQYADMEYVKFSKAIGTHDAVIMIRHLVPVATPDIAVLASSAMGSMILQISGLSFLGLGIQAPQAEWGMMLNEARAVMFTRPELMLAPGLAITVVVSAFHFLSDALQIALDPRQVSSNRAGRREIAK